MAYQVLVVDDMRSIYYSISSILVPRKCVVEHAVSGTTALSLAKENQYDIIILDIHLPDTNGIAVCEALRKIEKYQHTPILLLTCDTESLELGIKAGATDYILKPFNEVEMIARVFTQINISRHQRALHLKTTRLEKEYQQEKEKLSQTQEELHRYFYQTSHKLRSPLNSIKGLFNLLKLEFPEQDNPYLPLIEEGVDRMMYVNEQVSRIGYLRAHHQKPTCTNLKNFVEGVLTKLKVSSQIEVCIAPEMMVEIDEIVFRYGVEPIIENALFYNRLQNGGIKKIQIKTTQINKMQILSICDQGTGIPENTVSQVFDMFYIGHENSEGNGLGLFISKIAMDISNINIAIRSRKGEFTNVLLDLSNVVCNSTQLP